MSRKKKLSFNSNFEENGPADCRFKEGIGHGAWSIE
jgi:hypothetical protein